MRIIKLILILILSLVICVFVLKFISKNYRNSDSIMGRISNILNWNNNIYLTCKGINKEDINIVWYWEFGHKTVMEKGLYSDKIGNEYGINSFDLYYKDKKIGSVGHFKTNNWHSHDYLINITKINSGYSIDYECIGPDYDQSKPNF